MANRQSRSLWYGARLSKTSHNDRCIQKILGGAKVKANETLSEGGGRNGGRFQDVLTG